MDYSTFKAIAEYGLSVVGLVAVTVFLAWLIKFILLRNKDRESIYMELMKTDLKDLTESMHKLADNITNFSSNVNDAHKYQREEHEKMTSILNNACIEHKEMIMTLGRINGYKNNNINKDV
jgi:hypothetical protein